MKNISLILGLLFLAGCAEQYSRIDGLADHPMDLQTLRENRVALNGRVVTIDGFMMEDQDIFFMIPGTPRPANRLGEFGETYWCVGGPDLLWFEQNGLRREWKKIKPVKWGDFVGRRIKGRRVVLRGVLRDRGIEVPEGIEVQAFATARGVAKYSMGPLENVKIIRILDEYCGQDDPPKG